MKYLLAKAIEIAAVAHATQFDKGGNPYILHPIWVMNQVRHLGPTYMIVAILHDLIEDTDWTLDDLAEVGFPMEILEALNLLDFRGQDYMARIKQIAHNPLARAVKMRDLKHNSDITRLKGISASDFARLEKYSIAYKYLEKI